MSLGLMLSSGLTATFALRPPRLSGGLTSGRGSLRIRTPSIYTRGWLLRETLLSPRSRMILLCPTLPPPYTSSPGAAACKRSDTSTGRSGRFGTSICDTVFPISRRLAAPAVPVTTISSSPSATDCIEKSASTVWPATTETSPVTEPRPIRSTVNSYVPGGTLSRMNRPFCRVRTPRPVPGR